MTKSVEPRWKQPPSKKPRRGLRSRSEKRAAQEREYVSLRIAYLASHPACELRTPVCTRWATEIQHLKGRVGRVADRHAVVEVLLPRLPDVRPREPRVGDPHGLDGQEEPVSDTALTLFDAPHVPAPVPNGDQQHVLDALTLGPGTVHELRHRLGQVGIVRAENCIAKRLSELGPDTPKSKGMYLVERTGERRPGSSHRRQDEWRLA